MRWLVEVSSIGTADVQKFCVEAESWQRALQAARAQRSEEGPMSGFSIELLEEGYRAVDPVTRVRFVVKRTADDTPITAPLAKDGRTGVAPTRPSTVPPAAMTTSDKPESKLAASSGTRSAPAPRPIATNDSHGAASIPKGDRSIAPAAEQGDRKPSVPPRAVEPAPPTQLLPVGSPAAGLPHVKVLSSREQNPTEASPLTYREYSFAVPPGTSEEVAANVLRGQLLLIDAQIQGARMGKLVNLAAFDVEFTGRPPTPPLATLTWKDWKGEPVIGFPRRGTAPVQPKPPSADTSAVAAGPQPPTSPPTAAAPHRASAPPPQPSGASGVAAPSLAAAGAPELNPFTSTAPIPPALLPQNQSATAEAPPTRGSVPAPRMSPSQPPVAGAGSIPAAMVAPVTTFTPGSTPPLATVQSSPVASHVPAPTASEPAPRRPSSPDGMVRTPSGRFVRGRTTGDELITALFESMHDLHFLRDALDGGQFCLALATEVLPARAALIHFFDVEKREWVIACTRGKDTSRLLTMRTPEADEWLRDAARKRRAVVMANATPTAAERYQTLGGARSIIIAPIMQAGRALGAIEIINALDGMPFTEDEGNAMTYIAEQYAEYLGSRGIVLDRERIQSAAAPR